MSLPKKATEVVDALDLIPHPEGGFFVETYRSGSVPMSTMGQTGFQCRDPESNLVVANGRKANRPDGDERRNALTSITWVPTLESPIVMLAINCSDHVHYYQGGLPFQYFMFDAESGEFKTEILGPDIRNGHKLQIPVRGGLWKCGKILVPEGEPEFDYAAIGEGVAV